MYLKAEKKTCDRKFQIGTSVHGLNELECKGRCDEDKGCMFFFNSVDRWCDLYESCNQLRPTVATGTTFAKQGI